MKKPDNVLKAKNDISTRINVSLEQTPLKYIVQNRFVRTQTSMKALIYPCAYRAFVNTFYSVAHIHRSALSERIHKPAEKGPNRNNIAHN